MQRIIPLLKPSVTEREIEAVAKVLRSGWWGLGAVTEEFERKFAEYVGVKYAVAVNSATSALDLAFKVHNIKNKRVLMPALTFVSTGLAALYNNCEIVFGDINEETLILDNYKGKFDVAIPVWFGGRVGSNLEVTRGKHLVIEDAAHASGNKLAGGFGTACWSFHAVKNLATGDGGMLTTNDKKIYERAKALRWCGINKSTFERIKKRYGWDYDIKEVGYKYHMNDITAAIGLVQLERLDEMNSNRKMIAASYLHELKDLDWLKLPNWDDESSWHLFTVRIDKKNRDRFIDHLLSKGVSAGVHYKPLTHYKIFPKANLPVTERIWKELVTLPMYPDLTGKDFEHIVKSIRSFVP